LYREGCKQLPLPSAGKQRGRLHYACGVTKALPVIDVKLLKVDDVLGSL
jgi:hypothetical protein